MGNAESGIPQHKRFAMGDVAEQPESDFGVRKLASHAKDEPDYQEGRRGLKEGERALKKGRGYHAEPDHGSVD